MSTLHVDGPVFFPEATRSTKPKTKPALKKKVISPFLPSGGSSKWTPVQDDLDGGGTANGQRCPTIEVMDTVSELATYKERAQVLEELRPVLRLLISKLINFKFECKDRWVKPYDKTYIYGGENFFVWWEEQNNALSKDVKEDRPPFRRPLDIDVWVPLHVDSWEQTHKMEHKQNLFLKDLASIWNGEDIKEMWSDALDRLEAKGRLISDITLAQKQSPIHYFNPGEREHPTWANDSSGIYFVYKDHKIIPEDVRAAFKEFGEIQRVYFRRNHRPGSSGYACVFFKKEKDYKFAMKKGSVKVREEMVRFKAKRTNNTPQKTMAIDNTRMFRTITMEYYEDHRMEPVPLVEFQLRPRCAWGQHFKSACKLLLKPPDYIVDRLIEGNMVHDSSLDGQPTIHVLSIKDTYKVCNLALGKRKDKKVKSRTDIQRIVWFCKQFENTDDSFIFKIPELAKMSSIYDQVRNRLSSPSPPTSGSQSPQLTSQHDGEPEELIKSEGCILETASPVLLPITPVSAVEQEVADYQNISHPVSELSGYSVKAPNNKYTLPSAELSSSMDGLQLALITSGDRMEVESMSSPGPAAMNYKKAVMKGRLSVGAPLGAEADCADVNANDGHTLYSRIHSGIPESTDLDRILRGTDLSES